MMRDFFLIFALLFAITEAIYSSELSQELSTDSSTNPPRDNETLSSTTESNLNAVNNAASTTSSISLIPASPTPESDNLASSPLVAQEPPKRGIITYDQRQEGQYNIRADLDNFMIIMVPQSFSELFLAKSLTRNLAKSKDKTKSKHSYGTPNFLKYHEGLKQAPILNFNPRPHLSIDDINHVRRVPEFIEGRTPYHVDISSNDEPDRQVDVLPPPYPLAYQHLKPYHLEAEPTVIQALPPPDLHAAHVSDKFLETFNQFLSSGTKNTGENENVLRTRNNKDGPELGFYRLSRSIRGGNNAFDSDNSNALNSLSIQTSSMRNAELPGAAHLYPPIDVPKTFGYFALDNGYTHTAAEFQETTDQNLDDNSNLGRVILPSMDIVVPQDDVELELHGVSLLDRASKTLLDGITRCAPGYRRNSYNICREIDY